MRRSGGGHQDELLLEEHGGVHRDVCGPDRRDHEVEGAGHQTLEKLLGGASERHPQVQSPRHQIAQRRQDAGARELGRAGQVYRAPRGGTGWVVAGRHR
jgi:hypothetical protein